ncbi:sulfate permease family domain-containing protein [Ditylenchus destructor]|uniref:Sulfate permease family domain-containing protein n=1 Tax=Ditylenchus destructor TaxID=166010 RepID=A0AAD4NG37_9BILA|nr:sulfate permease family domain-containing protein [Ditylenchus destructor]
MNQEEFEVKFGRVNATKDTEGNGNSFSKAFKGLSNKYLETSLCTRFKSFAPILEWLPAYSVRQNLHGDLITGLTVGIMVVPQGMAYATLAGVDPVYGLYSCFFAAFIYMFFGTSRHVSIGTFAVASMMTHQIAPNITLHTEDEKHPFLQDLSPLIITSALTFGVGICQLLMGLCRLSFLTSYISDPLVSGFTTGAAVHVLFSQLDKALGVKVTKHHGPGMIIRMAIDLIYALPRTNFWTLGITIVGMTFLSVGRDYVNPWFKARYKIPLPLELFLVSYFLTLFFDIFLVFDIKLQHGVKIVDDVPEGMPIPSLPRLSLALYMWKEAISISVICYIFVFSMAKIFAKKHKYRIDPNQELYALGFCQLLASFFPVYPSGASLSRSSLCEMTGAKTQLHALFSSALLLVVILWLGSLLEPLPMAILSCIVMVSLKSLFLQFRELPKLWRISYIDFAIWIVAFVSTVCIDVTPGLIIGLIFVVSSVVLKEQWPKFYKLAPTPNNDVFRSTDLYTTLAPISDNTLVVRFESPLHFANSARFTELCGEAIVELCSQPSTIQCTNSAKVPKSSCKKASKTLPTPAVAHLESSATVPSFSANSSDSNLPDLDVGKADETAKENVPQELSINAVAHVEQYGDNAEAKSIVTSGKSYVLLPTNEAPSHSSGSHQCVEPMRSTHKTATDKESSNKIAQCPVTTDERYLIIDCSAVSHVDSMGIEAIWEVFKDGTKVGVLVKYAEFSDTILRVFSNCGLFETIPKTNFYPSVQEALLSTKSVSVTETTNNCTNY